MFTIALEPQSYVDQAEYMQSRWNTVNRYQEVPMEVIQ